MAAVGRVHWLAFTIITTSTCKAAPFAPKRRHFLQSFSPFLAPTTPAVTVSTLSTPSSDMEGEILGSIDRSEDVNYKERRFPSLAATMERRVKASPQYSRKRCIFRVPNDLRQINEQAYTPLLVSIGPLHHNDKMLLPMEAHKLKYLQQFLGDTQSKAADLLKSCLEIIKDKEIKIRKCYADPIYLSSDDFAQMVLIDSAFIIQLFRRIPRLDDYMYNKPFLVDTVLRDIKLEENQLPFFILNELYCASFQTNASRSNSVYPSFTKIACEALNVNGDSNANVSETQYLHLLHMLAFHGNPSIRTNTNAVEGGIVSEGLNVNRDSNPYVCQLASYFHRLHLLVFHRRTTIRNNKDDKAKAKIEDLIFPTATELHEAGVKFQVNKDSSSVFDIDFNNVKGILKIPKLTVSDDTEYIHRNLIAFEQCNYFSDETHYFTDFHFFLNWLINTPEDVQLLAKAGIIHNLMGSPKQVSDLINSLHTHAGTSFKGYYYGKISLELTRHCKRRWPRYRAVLMHTYFKHPWAAISVGYAIVLLFLTIAQVVAGFRPSH